MLCGWLFNVHEEALELISQLLVPLVLVAGFGYLLRPEDWLVYVPALMLASRYGRETIVKLLLESPKIDVNVRDEDGRTALAHGVLGGRIKTTKLLLEDPRVDKDARDNEGCTALMIAADALEFAVLFLLIDHGLDINEIDNNGRTALSRNAAEGRKFHVYSLLDKKTQIDINVRDKDGKTALEIAEENGFSEIVDLLTAFEK